ncbi:MAG: hypothetical protein KatS3mg024_1848 [Armatimonadota bacterium]|nr:MAG: hypothetical protein KatS3mg024_1848 [Armatimonadota bacterium]
MQSSGTGERASPQGRVASIDAFRGFTIFLMVLVIAVAGYPRLPHERSWFGSLPVSTWKHADTGWETFVEEKKAEGLSEAEIERLPEAARKKVGCTLTDLVAPFFVFIVGVCIPLSRSRRGAEWWRHVLTRTAGLIAAGVLYISLILGLSWWWGILQAIGVAYLMGAASLKLGRPWRWAAIPAVLIFHALMSRYTGWWLGLGDTQEPFWTIANPLGDPLKPLRVHCLPWVSISYGAITVAGVLLGEAVATRDHRQVARRSLVLGLLCGGSGLAIHQLGMATGQYDLCFNKPDVTASYALFTSGVAALTFLAFYWVVDVRGIRGWTAPLDVLGSNALLAYFMQIIMRLAFRALGIEPFFKGTPTEPVQMWAGLWDSPLWQRFLLDRSGYLGLAWGLLWTGSLWLIIRGCNRRGIFWKL